MNQTLPKRTSFFSKLPITFRKIFIFLIISSSPILTFGQTTETFSSSTTWKCPPGVISVTVESWGGGGGGGGSKNNGDNAGAGGGGGAYTIATSITVVPGTTYNIIVGKGGLGDNRGNDGNDGENSYFHNNVGLANGGKGGGHNEGIPGAGGAGGTYKGGNGAAANGNQISGGGGGGAGPFSDGQNSSTGVDNFGAGGIGNPNGNGGKGLPRPSSKGTNGLNGENLGGGGGGAVGKKVNIPGGDGGDGQVRITYTVIPPPTITAVSSTACAGGSIQITGTNFYDITASDVKIGTTPVTFITSFTSTSIVAVVGTASSGKVSVTTGSGIAISAATITVAKTIGGSVSGTISVCSEINSGTVNLTGHSGNIIRWESSTDNGANWNPIANTGSSQNYSNLTQTTQYRAVVKNSTCSSENSSPATISFGTTLYWGGKGSTMAGGTSNTDFNNSGNWSSAQNSFVAAGVAPDECTNVVIDISLNSSVTSSIITFSKAATTIKSLDFSVNGSSTKTTIYESSLRLGNQSLTITGSSKLYAENNTVNRSTRLSLDGTTASSLYIFEGDLYTSANNVAGGSGECVVYPFSNPTGTTNRGKFVLKGNAYLSGLGDDANPGLNKPTNLVFDGTGTQTITNNNSNGYPVYFGFNTLIGEVNSPTVILIGTNSLGYQTINNLTINNGSTLEIGDGQSLNRYKTGTPGNFIMQPNSTLKLSGSTYGVGNSNFPNNFATITLDPTSTVEYKGAAAQTIYSSPAYGNLTLSSAGLKTAGGNLSIIRDLEIKQTATFSGSSFTLSISGNWYNNSSPTAYIGNTSTVSFIGGAAQIIGGTAGTTFNHLNLNKSNSIQTLTNEIASFACTGDLNAATGNLVLRATNDHYYFNNVKVLTNGRITHNVNWDVVNKMISISGNLDVSGVFDPGVARSHVQMNGTGTKTISTGNNPASTLRILTFKNGHFLASGTLKASAEVWAMFGTQGSFSTNGQNVVFETLLNNNGTVNVNGGSLRVNNTTEIGVESTAGTLNVTAGTATLAGDLSIESTGTVIVDEAKMQIGGAIFNKSGTFNAKNGTIEMNSAFAQNIAGSMFDQKTIRNLIVSNQSTLYVYPKMYDTLKISGTLSFGHILAKLNTGNNLTLLSTAERTANLGKVGINNTITGTATVERFINIGTAKGQHAKSWQLLSVPTSGSTIKESWMENGLKTTIPNGYGTWISGPGGIAGGFDAYSGTPSMKTYEPVTDSWKGVDNPATTQIFNKSGYFVFVRGDRSVFNFSGANSSPITTTLRTTGTLLTGNLPAINIIPNFFQVIGNPYASAIDFKNITKSVGIDNAYYAWDPNLQGSYGVGGYQTISNVNGWQPIPGGTISYLTNSDKSTIQSGQSFLVYATGVAALLPITYSISFTENTKVNENTMKSFARPMGTSGENKRQLFGVNLYTGTGTDALVADGNIVAFDDLFNNDIDGDDAAKLLNDGENFGLKRDGKLLALEARKTITDADTLHYYFTKLKQKTYQLRFSPKNMETAGLEAYLFDKFLNINTPVSLFENSTVNITITNAALSAASDRFKVIFRPMAPLPVTFTSLKAVQKNGEILVEWKVENESNMQSYEVEKSLDGTKFLKQKEVAAINGFANQYQWLDKNAVQGYQYYRIHSKDFNGQSGYSQIVKVLIGATLPSITVYPNPSKGKNIHIQMSNQPSGQYDIRLLNALGQVLYSKSFEQQNGSTTQTIQWDNVWSEGIYQLEVLKPNGEVEAMRVMR